MSKVKIGVFGAGRGRTMIDQLIGNPEAELVAICDKEERLINSCRELAKEKGLKIEFFTDFDEFIQCDMDAAVLANYAHEHAKYGVRLLRSGRHIMSEVLTAANMAEAVELIEAVEQTGKEYVYAENYCYFNTTTEMRRRYRLGDIGELMHGEGEYIHDCSSIWPQITYGERDHWRNRMSSVFYCTHSIGPVLFATGLRPVKVVGFETQNMPFMRDLGATFGSAGILMLKLENGATVKSIDLALKRDSINYQLYGSTGAMETDRYNDGTLHIWQEEPGRNCHLTHNSYHPEFTDARAVRTGHGGSDFFTTANFVSLIQGDETVRDEVVGIYEAVDMCLPGILGYRSIVGGSTPFDIPNLRDHAERDKWRNDRICTFKESAGDQYIPNNLAPGGMDVDDAVYARVKKLFEEGLPG